MTERSERKPAGVGVGTSDDAAEETDWADALDAWEQKAFSSVAPPPLSAPPPLPSSVTETGATRAFPASALPPRSARVPPPVPDEDRTLASPGRAGAGPGRPSSEPPLDVTDDVLVDARSEREVDFEEIDPLSDETTDGSPSVPPPRREGARPAGMPTLPPSPPAPHRAALRPAPTTQPVRAPVRVEEARTTEDEPSPSAVTGTLRAFAALAPRHDDAARRSRLPRPSLRPLAPDLAGLLGEQAAWLEAEAAFIDEASRARVLLALSEIRATLGAREEARALAERARDLAPARTLAHLQTRSLESNDGASESPSTRAAPLLAEEASASLPAAKRHAALLAADRLREGGDLEGTRRLLARVAESGDVRGVVGRAAFGLALGDMDELGDSLTKVETKPIAGALTSALRLRGLRVGKASSAASPEGVSDVLAATKALLESGDTVAAAKALASLRAVSELSLGATWLAASLAATKEEGRALAVEWLGDLAANGDSHASRVLAARAVEADDGPAARAALALGGFEASDAVALSALLELELRDDVTPLAAGLGALEAAISAIDLAAGAHSAKASKHEPERLQVTERASRVVGTEGSRASVRLARALASNAPDSEIGLALRAFRSAPGADGRSGATRAVELELALRDGAYDRISDLLKDWGPVGDSRRRVADAALAAALVAERSGDAARALVAYREARALDHSSEVALRAVASLHASTDMPGELNELADEVGATTSGALKRLEAVMREDSVDDATRTDLLERAHLAAPSIPLASYLAERIALRNGNGDDVRRWIAARHEAGADPTELVVDAVREGRLAKAEDPDESAARAERAHRLRPDQLVLRELYERALYERRPAQVPADHAAFWEAQAARVAESDSRALVLLEVAYAHERAGDFAGALRVADAADGDATAAGDAEEAEESNASLLRLARERAELEGGEAARLVDRLLGEAKQTDSIVTRREAYARLADIDGIGRGDPTSALLWHHAILEESPDHLPSLRYLEHALVSEGRDDELEPIASSIAHALAAPGLVSGADSPDGGERVAHADLSARLRARGSEGDWDSTFEVAELATRDPAPSLASLRLLAAHARVRKDDALLVTVTQQLLDRATRPVEMAALRLRLSEAAFRRGDVALAVANLERCTTEDPGDPVAFRLLAEVRAASGDHAGAAEAHESVARLSLVAAHRREAWYEAATLWLTSAEHENQGVHALEQAAALDLSHEDIFPRLAQLYAKRGSHEDLAALLERRIALASDPDERVTLEVERGRALLASGDRKGARLAVAAALAARPDHTTALATFGELSAVEEDWAAAEDAWVRLARLLAAPEEQREIYQRLGDLYATKAVHLERAELAFKEVLKRAPGDIATLTRLVEIYRRQRDVTRAVAGQQELITLATSPREKCLRTIELAALHEDPGHDDRKAEQVLDGARREFPTDVAVLRALAEFYARHKQTPAVNILLDRASADARRAFAAGRFAPGLFEVTRAVFELRGNEDAARIVGASLLAIEGQAADVRGGSGAALDARLDDLLAPDVLTSGLRTLLADAGAMLDVAAPMDLRALGAEEAGEGAKVVRDLAASFAAGLGLSAPAIYMSKAVARTCLPASSNPPVLVVGDLLLTATNERAVLFTVMRAMKLMAARSSSLVRTTSTDLAVLVPAWLQALLPSWTPQGVNPSALAAAARKVALSTPPAMTEERKSLVLEVTSQLGTRASTLGALALAWANRAALLGVGDPNAALDALAWSVGSKDGAPKDPVSRAAFIGRTYEAKDLLIFSVGDAYAEARARLNLRR